MSTVNVSNVFLGNAPHDIVYITDSSTVTEVTQLDASATLLMPFVSDKGPDRVLFKMSGASSIATLNSLYGSRNFRRHGMPYYMLAETLKAGGKVIGMRITPDDATYANLLIKVALKVDAGVATVKVIGDKIETLTDTSVIDNLLQAAPEVDEVSGFTTYNLMVVNRKGRGSYGNTATFRLTNNDSQTAIRDYVNFNTEVLVTESGTTTTEGPFQTALKEDAYISGVPVYLEKLLTKYSSEVEVRVSEDSVDYINTALAPVAEANDIAVEKINYLVEAAVDQPAYVVFEEVEGTTIDLSTPYGISLTGGSDGSWSGRFNFESATRTGMTEQFAKFYTGELDELVFSLTKTQPSYILDANFPETVKSAMTTLAAARIDMHAYMDIGIKTTIAACQTYMEAVSLDQWNVSYYSQYCKVTDSDNDTEIQVTTPYLLAQRLPVHYRVNGFHKPIAGLNYGKIPGIISGTLYPRITKLTDKNTLYDLGLNYIEDDDSTPYFGTNRTMYRTDSKLQKQSNCRILSAMVRTLLLLVRRYRFDFTETDDIERFVRMGNEALETYNDKVSELSYTITQTDYQKAKGQLQDNLYVKFKDINEQNFVNIEVLGSTS